MRFLDYCKPRKENVSLIITNLAWVRKTLKFVGVNVLSYAHARIYTSPLQKNVPLSLAGCALEAPTCLMQRGEVPLKRQIKKVACELKRCDKRKRA